MKYTDFFNLREYPFNLTPDLRFYFRSESHRRALSYLSFGLSKGEGFVVITGEIGAGKTVFIDYFLSRLPKGNVVTATISSTQFQAESFLRLVASAFGLREKNQDKATVFRDLESFLLETHQRNSRAILIVDEAQGLPISALEELRMLSNIYHQNRPLLQVFLIGQPEFRRKLSGTGLEQLRQRIVAIHHLTPLSEDELRQYVLYRLQKVGWSNDPSFADGCFTAIHRETKGVPRLVNNLCDRLLWNAFIEESHSISLEDVKFVVSDMKIDADGLSLEIDPTADGNEPLELELEEEPEASEEAAAEKAADEPESDRVVNIRNRYEQEG